MIIINKTVITWSDSHADRTSAINRLWFAHLETSGSPNR